MVGGLLLAAWLVSEPIVNGQLQQSYWAVVVNEVRQGDVLVALDGDDVWMPVDALTRAGLINVGGRRQNMFGAVHVLLQSLAPDVSVRLDMAEVTLFVTAAARFFAERDVALQRARPEGIVQSHSPSAFLNYSATWDRQGGPSGFGEAGLSLLGTTSTVSGFTVDDSGSVTRGLSTITLDRTSARQRWQIGDTIARATPLGSGPIVAGISFGRDYSLDPYYLRYPTPFVRGTAASPSEAEVYINGALVSRLQIGPGPYRLDRLPLTSGLADVSVIVRDAFGGEQVFQQAVYLAATVLQRGEQDYQYVAGALRDDSSGAPVYGRVQGVAAHRIGVTDSLTIGYSGEGNHDVVAGGPTITARLGPLGELDVNAWGSRTRDGTQGYAAYGTYSFVSRAFNASAVAQYYDRRFANIYVTPGSSPTPEYYQVSAGVPLWSIGSVTYTLERRRSAAGNFGLTLPDDTFDNSLARSRTQTLRLNARVLPRTQLAVTAAYTLVRDRSIWTGLAALNVVIGRSSTASVSSSRDVDATTTTVDLNRSLPVGVGYGFRANASDANGGTASAQFEANTSFNRVRLTYDTLGGGSPQNASVTVSGSVLVSHGMFFSRPLDSSAAVVEVTGLPHVRVLTDNVEVARTDGSGRALIPDLLPYLANRIGYNQADIPFDYRIPESSQLIAPPYRGTAYVKFPTARIQARAGSVRMTIEGEDVVPSYGSIVAHREGGDVESPLNGDGEFFLDLPQGHYRATVTFKGASCEVEFEATPTDEMIQSVGRLRCSP